ncbi:MAG: TerB family tellurite resistance protein [Polyangiaceae bacterium]|nr:TerB family tellurite resistance protein [Polyangiaceae bacterium]
MRALVLSAIDSLCAVFEEHGYNPTPIIDLGVLVASADGKVDDDERQLLREIFQALLDTTINADIVDHMITASLDVIEAAGTESRARLVGAILYDCDGVESGIEVALAVAFASHGLSASERKVIDRIARAGHLRKAKLEELIARVRDAAEGSGPASTRRSLGSKAAT